jgi:hypothetical protein
VGAAGKASDQSARASRDQSASGQPAAKGAGNAERHETGGDASVAAAAADGLGQNAERADALGLDPALRGVLNADGAAVAAASAAAAGAEHDDSAAAGADHDDSAAVAPTSAGAADRLPDHTVRVAPGRVNVAVVGDGYRRSRAAVAAAADHADQTEAASALAARAAQRLGQYSVVLISTGADCAEVCDADRARRGGRSRLAAGTEDVSGAAFAASTTLAARDNAVARAGDRDG